MDILLHSDYPHRHIIFGARFSLVRSSPENKGDQQGRRHKVLIAGTESWVIIPVLQISVFVNRKINRSAKHGQIIIKKSSSAVLK